MPSMKQSCKLGRAFWVGFGRAGRRDNKAFHVVSDIAMTSLLVVLATTSVDAVAITVHRSKTAT